MHVYFDILQSPKTQSTGTCTLGTVQNSLLQNKPRQGDQDSDTKQT